MDLVKLRERVESSLPTPGKADLATLMEKMPSLVLTLKEDLFKRKL